MGSAHLLVGLPLLSIERSHWVLAACGCTSLLGVQQFMHHSKGRGAQSELQIV